MTTLHLFVDESGNFDFSPTGSRYFIFTVLSTTDPLTVASPLLALRYDLLGDPASCGKYQENGYFHATEDSQCVRDRVFPVLTSLAASIRVDAVVAEKRKANPTIRPQEKFYATVAAPAMKYACGRASRQGYDRVVAVLSTLFTKKRHGALVGALKTQLKQEAQTPFEVYFHDGRADLCTQAADYACWAISRKWESGDRRSYEAIQGLVCSEFEIFRRGATTYY